MTEAKGGRMGVPMESAGRGGRRATRAARWMRLVAAVIVAAGALSGAVVAAGALVAGDDAVIHACVQQPQGSLRVIADPSLCRSSERALSWRTGVAETVPDAGGPRVDAVALIGDELRLKVSAPVLAGSVTLDAFAVTLWLDAPGQWRSLPLTAVAVDGMRTGIRVGLGEAVPAGAWLRVVVRGTGPKPVLGEDHVPLAGVVGGPPGTAAAGHDAVVFRPVADLVS